MVFCCCDSFCDCQVVTFCMSYEMHSYTVQVVMFHCYTGFRKLIFYIKKQWMKNIIWEKSTISCRNSAHANAIKTDRLLSPIPIKSHYRNHPSNKVFFVTSSGQLTSLLSLFTPTQIVRQEHISEILRKPISQVLLFAQAPITSREKFHMASYYTTFAERDSLVFQ